MMKSAIGAACATVLVALTGGLFTPTATHAAAVYTGTFDPQDANYQWEGTHRFAVSEACLLSDGWRSANAGYGCDAQLLGGSLSLRRKTGPDQGFKTLTFGEFPTSNVWGVFIRDGQLAGVDTYLTGPLRFTAAEEAVLFDAPIFEGGGLSLRWESGKAPLSEVPTNLFANFNQGVVGNKSYVQSLVDPVYLYRSLGNSDNYREVTPGQSAQNVTFRPAGAPGLTVPEPGSLALVGVALAAAAALFRRRRSGG